MPKCFLTIPPLALLTLGLLGFFGAVLNPVVPWAADPAPKERMYLVKVTHICIITRQFDKMQEFYKRILHLEPTPIKVDYVEFETPGAIVSLYEEESFAQIAPAAVPKPGTGGMMLELQVADVDQEFRRLQGLGLKIKILLPPTTFPWGNRSIYLQDPDGNLINLYSTVSSQ